MHRKSLTLMGRSSGSPNRAGSFALQRTAAGTLLAALFLFSGQLPFARAAATSCQFQNDFDKIAAIERDGSLDLLAKTSAELAIRKGILQKAIGCLMQDALNLKGKLAELPIASKSDVNLIRVRDRLSLALDQTIDFYASQQLRVGDLGIRGSQDLAQTLQEWKTTNYVVASGETVSFIIWFKNQPLIAVARDRFNQVEASIKEAGLTDNQDINNLLQNSAKVNLTNARLENDNALKDFISGSDPALSLRSIKASLQSLTDMYQNFFDIGELVKKIPSP